MSPNLWFIVGATSGFGHEIAKQALARGDLVVATSRRATTSENLQSLSSQHPQDILLLDLDATSSDEIITIAFSNATNHFDRAITYFINAVGYLLEGAAEEISAEEGLRSITTNVLAVMNLSRCEATHLRSRNPNPSNTASSTTNSHHIGGIANFGSVGSWQGGAAYSHYAAAKWAVSGFTESIYEELRPFGIHALCVEPGYFRTGFLNEGGGNRIFAQKKLDREYTGTPVEGVKQALKTVNNNQPGDVVKGCRVIIDVLTGTGVAEGKERGDRLLLGRDCVKDVRAKMEKTERYIRNWEGVITKTDHDDVEA